MLFKSSEKRKIGPALIAAVLCIMLLQILMAGCSTPAAKAKDHLEKGKALIGEKKYEDAAKELNQYATLKPEDPEGHILLYRTLMEANRPDEAYTMLNRGYQALPKNDIIMVEMGKFYTGKGQFEKAKELFNGAAKINPQNLQSRYLKGIILLQEGNQNDAYAVFNSLLTVDPKKGDAEKEAVTMAYTFLLEIIGAEGRTDDQSKRIIEGAIAFMPDYSRGYAVMGIYGLIGKNTDGAVRNFETALAKGADKNTGKNREAFLNKILGRIYDERGDKAKALKYYENFLKVYGSDGRSRIRPEEAAEIRVFASIDDDILNLQAIRDRVKELKN